VISGFVYTSDASHPGPGGPADHARTYCDGSLGCLFSKTLMQASGPRAFEGGWVRCPHGCCEITFGG
jgi:hypothetical protein